MNRILGVLLFLVLLAAGLALAGPLRLLIDLQETTATMMARWTYDAPADQVSRFIWSVANEETGAEVERDTTELLETREWSHTRTDADVPYIFHLRAFKIVDAVWYPSERPYTERYVIPARAPYVLVAETLETTRPDSIPYDPTQQIAEGTLWIEFTPNSVVGRQGLWSKDFNGYQTGGHLSVWLEGSVAHWRIQDTTQSYEHQRTGVVAGQLNQIAVEFGSGGFKGWLNGTLAFTDSYTGGLTGNENAIVVGANSQSALPWNDPLDGTVHRTELYDGVYDFSWRWGEPPVPPIEPPPSVCDTCVEVIRLSMARSFVDSDGQKWFQMLLAPATFREIDYRVGQTESFQYEVWNEGQRLGYTIDADWGVVECWKAGQGEVCPVRPFRSGDGREHVHVRELAARRAPGVQLLGRALLDERHRGFG